MTDPMGKRMKRYEQATKQLLPLKTHTIIRVDGRSFHTYLKDVEKPFCKQFAEDMDAVAVELCKEIDGAVFAYTQSDEISILVTDLDSEGQEPWFGGVLAKMQSVSASIATAKLNSMRSPEYGKHALFDSRVFTIPDPGSVVDYFIWRQKDCIRNSISSLGQSKFSHHELIGVSGKEVQDMLYVQHGINWSDSDERFKRGSIVQKKIFTREVMYIDKRTNEDKQTTVTRSHWDVSVAPHFNTTIENWLMKKILYI